MAAVRGASDRGRFFQIDQRDPVREEQLALEAVRLAIDLGAEIDAVDEAGDTALHSAATRRLNTVIRLLAERGASLSVKNKRGQTPLALAEAADRRQTGRADEEAGEQQPTGALLRELGAVE